MDPDIVTLSLVLVASGSASVSLMQTSEALTPASLAWNSHIALTSRQHPRAGFEYVDSYLWSVWQESSNAPGKNVIIRQSYIIHLLAVCTWLQVHVFTSWPPLGLPIDFANHPLGEAICSWSPIHGVGLPRASYAIAEYGDLSVKQSQESTASLHTMCWGTVLVPFFFSIVVQVCSLNRKTETLWKLGQLKSSDIQNYLFWKYFKTIQEILFKVFPLSSLHFVHQALTVPSQRLHRKCPPWRVGSFESSFVYPIGPIPTKLSFLRS